MCDVVVCESVKCVVWDVKRLKRDGVWCVCGTECNVCGRARLTRARARSGETSEGGGENGDERSDGRTYDEGADAVVDGTGEGNLKLVPELGVEHTGGRVVVTFG